MDYYGYKSTPFLFLFFSLVFLVGSSLLVHGQAGTRVGFYSTTCPNAESIVQSTVASHFRTDSTIAPGLLRMHFHDCFVQGCDGSVLISGANSERTAGANLRLHGFDVIDDAKTQLEAACPGVVSCADILALATRDSVVLTGGQRWQVPTGRRDGRVSLASNVNNLPAPSDSVAVQRRKFAAFGLNTLDLVTLVGGHTIGTTACGFIRREIFDATGNSTDPTLVAQLQTLCPQNGGASGGLVALDMGSPNTFDTSFFSNLRSGRGLLQSDQSLWTDPSTRAVAQRFLAAGAGGTFNTEFARAMVKMGNIGVKTGTNGEIRRVCSAIN